MALRLELDGDDKPNLSGKGWPLTGVPVITGPHIIRFRSHSQLTQIKMFRTHQKIDLNVAVLEVTLQYHQVIHVRFD